MPSVIHLICPFLFTESLTNFSHLRQLIDRLNMKREKNANKDDARKAMC